MQNILSEDIYKQIRLMDYDRSKTLLEQSVIGAPNGGFIESPKSAIKDLSNLTIDDFVDIISAIIGSVPGLGTLGSAIIDLLHAISYFIRVFTTNDFKKQVEYGILGIVQLLFAFDPTGAGGNVLMLAARGEIKKVYAMTSKEIIFKLKELELYDSEQNMYCKKYGKNLIVCSQSEFIHSSSEEFEELANQIKIKIDEYEAFVEQQAQSFLKKKEEENQQNLAEASDKEKFELFKRDLTNRISNCMPFTYNNKTYSNKQAKLIQDILNLIG